jgi:uncharacterized protein (DUF2236 family)
LIESAVLAYECVLPALTADEVDAYYAESKTLAGLFGLAPHAMPSDWNSFKAYIADMTASQALGVSERSRFMAERIMSGSGSRVHVPHWYKALTTELLPSRFREEFRLAFGAREQASAQ